MRQKITEKLQEWKQNRHGESALLIEAARKRYQWRASSKAMVAYLTQAYGAHNARRMRSIGAPQINHAARAAHKRRMPTGIGAHNARRMRSIAVHSIKTFRGTSLKKNLDTGTTFT